MVSIYAMTKIESRTPKNLKFSTAERSALSIIGAGFGGILIHAPGPGAMPRTKATIDAARIPSRNGPGKPPQVKTAIARKPKIAISTTGEARLPILTGAPGTPIRTIPGSFNPTKVRNSQMPAAKLWVNPGGSESIIHCRVRATVSRVKIMPATNTAPSATSQR